jgi:hypothetical protein
VESLTNTLTETQKQLQLQEQNAKPQFTPKEMAILQEKLKKIDKLTEGTSSSSKGKALLVQPINQPLTPTLSGTAILDKFKDPIFAKYNGMTDPRKHIWQFDAWLQVHADQKDMCAKMFKGTLEGNTAI